MSSSSSQFGQVPRRAHVSPTYAQMPLVHTRRIYALLVLAAGFYVAIALLSMPPGQSVFEPMGSEEAALNPIWPLPADFEIGGQRKIFPYSIIPGGAESPEELKSAVSTDPVVAKHYADFNLAKVRAVTLAAPQLMYVSYRIGNNVFWTKHKLALPEGERMLTDGTTMARTRCGNRVSAEPIRPTSVQEPESADFGEPEFAQTLSTPYLAAFSVPAPAIPGVGAPGNPGSNLIPVTPFFPLPGGSSGHSNTPPPGIGGGGNPPSGGGGGTPPPGGGGTPPPGGGGGGNPPPGGGGGGNPPPIGIPEPGTAGLVLLCVSTVWIMRRSLKAC